MRAFREAYLDLPWFEFTPRNANTNELPPKRLFFVPTDVVGEMIAVFMDHGVFGVPYRKEFLNIDRNSSDYYPLQVQVPGEQPLFVHIQSSELLEQRRKRSGIDSWGVRLFLYNWHPETNTMRPLGRPEDFPTVQAQPITAAQYSNNALKIEEFILEQLKRAYSGASIRIVHELEAHAGSHHFLGSEAESLALKLSKLQDARQSKTKMEGSLAAIHNRKLQADQPLLEEFLSIQELDLEKRLHLQEKTLIDLERDIVDQKERLASLKAHIKGFPRRLQAAQELAKPKIAETLDALAVCSSIPRLQGDLEAVKKQLQEGYAKSEQALASHK